MLFLWQGKEEKGSKDKFEKGKQYAKGNIK